MIDRKTILITGGAGFIGSNFLSKYIPAFPDIRFVNIDALTYAGDIENIAIESRNSLNYAFEWVDIRDIDALRLVYEKYSPTDIIHFAAESHVDNSIRNPRLFTEVNILGTQNLLDLHREFGLKRFHYISTDEVYGDALGEMSFTEQSPLKPSSPYAASKAGGDLLTQAYGRTFGIDYVITRCSNNYGPNQYPEKLIPYFLKLLRDNQEVPLYGNGANARDWIHVTDHCDAVWEVFTFAKSGSIYNIAGDNSYSNLQITRILLDIMGKGEEYISFIADRPGHDVRYSIDTTKIQKEFGWYPKKIFREELVKLVNLFQK